MFREPIHLRTIRAQWYKEPSIYRLIREVNPVWKWGIPDADLLGTRSTAPSVTRCEKLVVRANLELHVPFLFPVSTMNQTWITMPCIACNIQLYTLSQVRWHLLPKLRTYKTFKKKFKQENYLSVIKDNRYMTALVRFRISSHKLKIETGYYTKLKTEKFVPTAPSS